MHALKALKKMLRHAQRKRMTAHFAKVKKKSHVWLFLQRRKSFEERTPPNGMEKEYAQALFDLSRKPKADAKEIVEKLVQHLKETGRQKLLPRILRELKRIESRAQVFDESLEVASEAETKQSESE